MNKKIIMLCIIFFLALLVPGALGAAGCVSTFDLNASREIVVYPGTSLELNATVWNVKCGVKHVILYIEDLPENWVEISPEYIRSISPFETGTFNMSISIPGNAGIGEYVGTYKLRAIGEGANYSEFLSTIHDEGEVTIAVREYIDRTEQEEKEIIEAHRVPEKEEQEPSEARNLLFAFVIALLCLLYIFTPKPKIKRRKKHGRKKSGKKVRSKGK